MNIWKTLVIIYVFSEGIPKIFVRNYSPTGSQNRSKLWYLFSHSSSIETFDEFQKQFTYMEWTVPENKGTEILMKIKNNDVWEVPPWGGEGIWFFFEAYGPLLFYYIVRVSQLTIHIKPTGHTQTSVHIQSP